MLQELRVLGTKFGLACLLVGIFFVSALAQVVGADQTITGTSCNNNGTVWYGLIETVWVTNEERAQTNNGSGAGCTHFWVGLAAWWFPPSGGPPIKFYRFSEEKTGVGTGWWYVNRFTSPNHFYVAAHTVQRRVDGQLPSPLYTLFSSNDAAHSSPNYFCSGTATGSAFCRLR